MGQKLAENAKLQKFKCDILSNCNNVRTRKNAFSEVSEKLMYWTM